MKPLTVKELIEKLQECDPEMEICMIDSNGLSQPCIYVEEIWRCRATGYCYEDKQYQKYNSEKKLNFEKVYLIDWEPS